MEIIDFHTHAFTDSLAERAMSSLSHTSGIEPSSDGTVGGLLKTMDICGISRSVILPIATKPSQQHTINSWAAQIMSSRIRCCGTVHPDAPDALDEIERIKELGLCGIKLHSEYQDFNPDEERMLPIYRKAAECGLFVVFHGGWDPYSKDVIRATPERMAIAAESVPELIFIFAHLGGMNQWDDAERYIVGRLDNVYLDVSVIAGYIKDEQLLRIIRNHGADKILFGSDCPWDLPSNEIAMINRLPLSDEEKEKIFHKNAEHLLLID